MEILSYGEIMNSAILLIAVSGGLYFVLYYIRDRRHQRMYEERRLSIEMENLKATTNKSNSENEITGPNNGGYILIDLDDKLRSTFTDLLKGFEEFAKLKGYNISFSVDNSIPSKIAFKFTLLDGGISVSTNTVRKDINEYIAKVQNGDGFDDLPHIISEEEHIVISSALKNRINFLTHNYNLEKNTREAYEAIIRKINGSNHGFNHQPTIFIQTGGINTPKNLIAQNSSNVIQGEDVINDNYSTHDNSIVISNSFNKRKEQINRIDDIIKLLRQEKNIDELLIQDLVTNFSKVKDEIQDEENPDKKRIKKWLSNTKAIVEKIVLSHEATQAIQWIYENFGFLI